MGYKQTTNVTFVFKAMFPALGCSFISSEQEEQVLVRARS